MNDKYAHLGPYWTVVSTCDGVETISLTRATSREQAIVQVKESTFLPIDVTEVHEGDVRDRLMRERVG